MSSTVSIIIPCFNEEKTIKKLLAAIYDQSYLRSHLEVVIADGMSTDGTRQQIESFAKSHMDLRITVVDNQRRIIPAALNLAIQNAQGDIIIRLDGHSVPFPDYVEKCVAELESNRGEVVGGIWEIRPGRDTWVAESIAIAASHRLAVGDAHYRHTQKPAFVDTVPFGAFKRDLVTKLGFFDETLHVNEDYEFNTRVRESGGKIWLNPQIQSVYYARGTWGSLVKQYWRYGFWKSIMLRRYPHSLRWRQALPPLFVFSLFSLALLGFLWRGFHITLGLEILIYTFALIITSINSAWKHRRALLIFGLPLAIVCMHVSWGSGFLWGMINGLFHKTKLK